MLEKNIIELAEPGEPCFFSKIFTRKKKEGSLRIILDLTELNAVVVYRHFKMGSLQTAVNLMSKIVSLHPLIGRTHTIPWT